jgi:hypothetical protein
MKDKIELTYEAFKRWWDKKKYVPTDCKDYWADLYAEAEKPEKKKALAYVSESGAMYFVIEGTEAQKTIETMAGMTYKRQECFDIESGD